jgi:hypothetical protein
MTLVRCMECKGQVSSLAAACPKCGAPLGAANPAELAQAPRSALLAQVRAKRAAEERSAQARSRDHNPPWVWVTAVALALVSLWVYRAAPSGHPKREPVERYGAVSGDFNAALSRALVASRVTGCGQMRWQAVTNRAGQYRVFCSRDGSHWDQYRVTASGAVTVDYSAVDGAVMDALLTH